MFAGIDENPVRVYEGLTADKEPGVGLVVAGRAKMITHEAALEVAKKIAGCLTQPEIVTLLEALTPLALECDECGAPLDQIMSMACRACERRERGDE